MDYQDYVIIFSKLLKTQLEINNSAIKSMSIRLTTQNFFQITIFHDGIAETVWNIDSIEKMCKFYNKCKSLK